jgi:hypothetical protein
MWVSALLQPCLAATASGLAQGEGGDALGEARHDFCAFARIHGDPAGDFTPRAPAADAKAGFRFDNANLDAGRFDVWSGDHVHGIILRRARGQ